MSKIIIFIDGSNFYHRLKFLTKNFKDTSLLDFDYKNFSEWLCGENELTQIRYYIGAVKRKNNDKSEDLYRNQQKLFRKLQNFNIEIIQGHLIQHPDKTYHEKGVDVRLAVDMIKLARNNEYDKALLLSSDTDLVPAVEEVLSLNKRVKYICSSDNQSFGLTKICKDYLVLREDDIYNFLPKKLL